MKFTLKDSFTKKKHGIKLNVYTDAKQVPQANVSVVSCEKGHFEEFYNKKSTFIYYVLKGRGTFYLNGKPVKVKATDLVIAKPKTKIYYLGKMKLLLTVIPAWKAQDEVHVRFIKK